MCCEPRWTASGQTHWVVMEVLVKLQRVLVFSSILLWNQNTSTRMNTDSHTGRAVHSGKKKTKQKKRWVEMFGDGGGCRPLLLSAWYTRCRLFHVVHVDSRGPWRDLSSSPFCFSALQDSRIDQRLPALMWLPNSASGPQDFNTFVFSAISVK